ncbi:MAG: hypothetical protein J6S54_09905 [Lentisphaeria bacterium]|nr:hypothetical protein [Lentisphaeria bacterium]
MKNIFAFAALLSAVSLAAAPLDLQMPFKQGRKTPVSWWETQGKLVDVDGVKAVALEKLQKLQFKNSFPGKAGDKLVYEITMKRDSDNVSLRIGQWSKEGWIGENFVLLKGKKEFSVVKGEIVLKDAAAPDKAGVLRKVSHFHINIYAHSNSKGTVIKDVKIDFVPAK